MSRLGIMLVLVALPPSLAARDITTLDGKVYRDCLVTRVDPDGICLLHSGGGARVKFTNLVEQLRAAYAYDPQKAAEYEQAQSARNRREEAQSRAQRALIQARKQAALTNVNERTAGAEPAAARVVGMDQPRREAAGGLVGPQGQGIYGPSSGGGGGYPGGSYGGGAEYVGVILAPDGNRGYGQSYGAGYQGGLGSVGGSYVGVSLAPGRSGMLGAGGRRGGSNRYTGLGGW